MLMLPRKSTPITSLGRAIPNDSTLIESTFYRTPLIWFRSLAIYELIFLDFGGGVGVPLKLVMLD